MNPVTVTDSENGRKHHFLRMMKQLRHYEEVVLYGNILSLSAGEQEEVTRFLEEEFKRESHEYPHKIPPFNANAALWAAVVTYLSAQLILYRENKAADIPALLPAYTGEMDASAILSADLCLRFIPGMIVKLKLIDPEDALIPLMEKYMVQWPFSAVDGNVPPEQQDFSVIAGNPCLKKIFTDRIIEKRQSKLAAHPVWHAEIKAALGMYTAEFWSDFTLINAN
jgi:hypothetical protein